MLGGRLTKVATLIKEQVVVPRQVGHEVTSLKPIIGWLAVSLASLFKFATPPGPRPHVPLRCQRGGIRQDLAVRYHRDRGDRSVRGPDDLSDQRRRYGQVSWRWR